MSSVELVVFGWLFAAAMVVLILVPYLRGVSDLFTSWNLFLLGSIKFVGLSSVFAGSFANPLSQSFPSRARLTFVIGASVLYATLGLVYFLPKFPSRLAARYFRKWPRPSTLAVVVLAFPAVALAGISMALPNIQFLGQILASAGIMAPIFLVGVVFALWFLKPSRIWLLPLLLAASALALITSIEYGIGRRDLLSLLFAFAIVIYWVRARYWSPLLALSSLALLGVLAFSVVVVYSGIRHRHVGASGGAGLAFARLSMIFSGAPVGEGRSGVLSLITGDDAVGNSLTAIEFYRLNPEPFFTLYWVITNPIPRAYWPEKPEAVGLRLPRETGQFLKSGYVNWGPGIVGHMYHEGGLWACVFYGVLFGLLMRCFDELLARHATNPYMLGIFASISGQVIAFSRGDIAVFLMQILAGVIINYSLCLLLRLLTFGGVSYIPVQELEGAPRLATA